MFTARLGAGFLLRGRQRAHLYFYFILTAQQFHQQQGALLRQRHLEYTAEAAERALQDGQLVACLMWPLVRRALAAVGFFRLFQKRSSSSIFP